MKKILLALALTFFLSGAAFAETAAPSGAAPSGAAPSGAAPSGAATASVAIAPGASPIETLAKQAIIVDAATGNVLYAKNADARMPTSSMSKILTMYLVYDAIKKGKIGLDSVVTISDTAWKQPGSRTFLNVGQQVKIEDLVRGVIVQSGNDAAVALAEAVAGSEGAFVGLMNDKARELGMANSHFMNATGLPDPEHYSTARDLATLALAMMRDFPEFYHYDAETSFTFNNIKQGNRNPLLYRNIGVDGMKTGHTDDGGYGLIASALRDGRRVVVVVNGLSSMQQRADEPAKLLDWAYREFGTYDIVKAADKAGDAKVWLGEAKTVPVVPAKDVSLTLARSLRDKVKVEATINAETQAPIQKGEALGRVIVTPPDGAAIEVPLVASEDVKLLGFFPRLAAKMRRLMGKE